MIKIKKLPPCIIDFKKCFKENQLETYIDQIIHDNKIEPLRKYEKLITANDEESKDYEVFYKGKKIRNVVKIVKDRRIPE